jgi:hypothetical protein
MEMLDTTISDVRSISETVPVLTPLFMAYAFPLAPAKVTARKGPVIALASVVACMGSPRPPPSCSGGVSCGRIWGGEPAYFSSIALPPEYGAS